MESDLADLRNKLQLETQSKEKAIRAEENALKQYKELKSQLESQTSVTSNADSKNKEIEAKMLKLQLDLEDAQEETKRLNTIKRRYEDEVDELKEEIDEEKEVADNALLAKNQLEKEKTQLEDQLDIEIQRRQEEAKQKQQILQEKETLAQTLQDFKKNAEKEKSEIQSKLEQEKSEKVTAEKKLSSTQKDLEDIKKIKESLESENSQLKTQLENSKKQLQSQNSDKEIAQLKSQLENTSQDLSKLKQLLSTKDQDIKNLQKSQQPSFEEENKNLRAELEALKKQLAEQPTEEEEAAPGPRLSVPRRVAPARSGRKPPSSTIGTPQSPAEEEPTTPVKKPINVAAMGGVNLFGGAGLTPDMLSKSKALTPASPQGPISDSPAKNRLWCVKGRRRVRSFQVEVSHKSLNKGDVFVLDTPKVIYQWNGSECNRLERTKGKDITSRILRQRTSFGAKPDVITIDEGDPEDENAFSFWKEMGGKGPLAETTDDLEMENYLDSINKLYQVGGNGDLEQIEGKLVVEMLSSDSSYILDAKNEVYIWIGKNSKKDVRSIAVTNAQELFDSDKERAPWAEIYKYPEGGESVFFCEKFGNWPDGATLGPQKFSSNVAKSKAQEKIDVEKMLTVEPPVTSNIVKDTEGVTEIWIVNEAVKEEQQTELYGQFWTENSYVVLFTYGPPEDCSYLIYYWLGRKCNKNEKGTCAALALNLAKKLKGATQVRVPQGKEPKHFLQLFKGTLVIHQGNQRERDNSNATKVYCVKGGSEEGEVASIQSTNNLLNSNHTFIFSNNSQLYIWKGKYSNKSEVKASPGIAKVLNPNVKSTLVEENSENDAFWRDVGGKKSLFSNQMKSLAKCFFFSNATGMVTAEPVWNFTQEDFTTDSVLLLDCNFTIYLWIGQKARENDKKVAMETTLDYAAQRKLPTLVVNEGKETLGFVSQFPGWDGAVANLDDSSLAPVSEKFKEYSGVKTYSLEELKNRDKLPSSVDKSVLEKYLSDEEFAKLFGMDKAAWEKLPSWKKGPIKKQLDLF